MTPGGPRLAELNSGENASMDDASVLVRRARTDESDAAAGVISASRAASVPAIPPEVHSNTQVRKWFEEVVMRQMEVWVAESQAEHILMGVMALRGNRVEQLYVLPGRTGQGIGPSSWPLPKVGARQASNSGRSSRTWEPEGSTSARVSLRSRRRMVPGTRSELQMCVIGGILEARERGANVTSDW